MSANTRRAWADYGTWTVSVLGILTVAYFIWLIAGPAGTASGGSIADAVNLPFGLGASVLALRTALSLRGQRRAHAAWLALGLAFLAFWAGDVLWFVSDIAHKTVGFPSWADAGYLAYYPLLLAGLILLAQGARNKAERLRFSLDTGVVVLGGALLVWYFVLMPALRGADGGLGAAIAVAYPAGDLLLLLGVASLALRRSWLHSSAALVTLVGGLSFGFVADLMYGGSTAQGTYSGGGLIDGLYLLSWLMLALAAKLEFDARGRPGVVEARGAERSARTSLVPYLSIVAGLAVVIYALHDNFGNAESAAAVVAVLVVGLSMTRQLVVQRESSRLREEKAARLGEERFQKALRRTQFSVDRAEDSVIWLDPEGRVCDVNESACRRLEYARDELLGMNVLDIDSAYYRSPEAWSDHWRLIKDQGPLTFERQLRAKSGRCFPAETTVNYIEFDGEEYCCSFSRDISDRKRSEKTLRDSEERLVRAQAVAHVGNWELELSTGMLLASAEARRIYGIDHARSSLLLAEVRRVALDEDRPQLEAALRGVVEGGGPYDQEYRIVRPSDGSVRLIRSIADLVRDDEGIPTKVVGLVQDITDARRAEEMLRLTQFSVDQASDAILWLTSDGFVHYASDSACRRLAYLREELLSIRVFELVPGESPETWWRQWTEIKKGHSLTFEKRFRAKDGEVFPAEVSANFFEYEGREYTCAFVRDVGERKRVERALRETEEQLRQSQKMEAIGQLAGGIAHDFNNLLTAISGYSELILVSGECASGTIREDVKEIKTAAERAAVLTRQILAFSRRQTLRPQVVSLNDVVLSTQRLLSRTLGADIEVVTLLPDDLGYAEVDENQMGQVLMNLALNARDAMPGGGTLTLETANVETANVESDEEDCRAHPGVPPGSYVMLAVSDTGTGMDEETQSHMFEPFFTTKGPGKGTGLGLSSVYGTVKQSGGSIVVQTEQQVGTVFRIYLPRVAGRPKGRPQATDDSRVTGGRETILLVEDEAGVRELVARVLRGLGYNVLDAGDGDEALSCLEQWANPIDMLLTDVILPGSLQGNELAQVVSARHPRLPVLFMSGYTRDAIVHSGRLDPGVNYIEKPFSLDDLACRVRQVLDARLVLQ